MTWKNLSLFRPRFTKSDKLGKRLNTFSRDERGTSAIEFVLVFPLFMVAYFGMVSVLDTENMTTEGGKVSSTIADIIAQSSSVTSQVIDNTLNAGVAIAGARAQNMQMYVAGVEVRNTNSNPRGRPNYKAYVVWARGRNNSSLRVPAKHSEYPLNSSLMTSEGFLVVSKVRMVHKPLYQSSGSYSHWLGSARIDSGENVYDYESSYVPREDLVTGCSDC